MSCERYMNIFSVFRQDCVFTTWQFGYSGCKILLIFKEAS